MRSGYSRRVCFDEMILAPVMQQEIGLLATCERPVTDEDIASAQRWIQDAALWRIRRETVKDAILLHASERSFHPVRSYLQSLQWDRTKRIGVWLPRYLGTELNDYTQH